MTIVRAMFVFFIHRCEKKKPGSYLKKDLPNIIYVVYEIFHESFFDRIFDWFEIYRIRSAPSILSETTWRNCLVKIHLSLTPSHRWKTFASNLCHYCADKDERTFIWPWTSEVKRITQTISSDELKYSYGKDRRNVIENNMYKLLSNSFKIKWNLIYLLL